MSTRTALSVIVPAHQGASVLPLSLPALAASDLPRSAWELIVVDDASSDETGALADRWADRVVKLGGRPHGPGYARNRGAEIARGEWLVFIDADVVAHQDTLRLFVEAIEADPTVDALFGAYDDAPPAPGLLSQYRNLLHRYVHLTNAGAGETFWGGCGAIRRATFLQVGGFDERRYRRPQIEDIELGYRLRDRGHRIAVRPEIQGTHLKRWTLLGSFRTDLLDRGIPWALLLLERRRLSRPANLNLKHGEPAKVFLAWAALPLLLLGSALGRPLLTGLASLMLLAVVLSNLPLFVWLARQRGRFFALAAIPLNIGYYLISGLSVAAAIVVYIGAAGAGGSTAMMRPSQHLSDELVAAAFLRVDKLAFGVATGVSAACIVFLATAVHLLREAQPGFPLELLGQYFAGYSVTWPGAIIGAAWAGFSGFILGWLLAFSRNLLLGVMLVFVRGRAQWDQARSFLDHL